MYILGISAFYHDSAAALICDGEILSAAEEERFSRIKHDKEFPINAIEFCLNVNHLKITDIDFIVFYDRPFDKFERIIETILWSAPVAYDQYMAIFEEWFKNGKLALTTTIKKELIKKYSEYQLNQVPPIKINSHHLSHASSAFHPSPFKKAAILCIDGVGEWATTSAWIGEDEKIKPLWQIDFPHSLGLLYCAFTYYLGFKINDGEYKVMGLAPYGEPIYKDLILSKLIDVKDDGTFRLNMEYFNFTKGLSMTNEKFHQLFGNNRRLEKDPLTDFHKNIARSIQAALEEIVVKLAISINRETGCEYLCLAGGVALNCVANSKISELNIFKEIWVAPASGDSGGAIGAALSYYYQELKKPRAIKDHDSMKGSFLGPSFTNDEIKKILENQNVKATFLENHELFNTVASDLNDQKVIGWFQGKMEFGPRSLGARSILADPRSKDMQSILNLKIKYRESFRPFAPAVLLEDVEKYFLIKKPSPYMLFTPKVRTDITPLPSITHLDQSARVQTVDKNINPRFYDLILAFKNLTNCSVTINTSFNIRGEPIVATPIDAIKCFFNTEMDVLVLENYYITKDKQFGIERFKYTTEELSPYKKSNIYIYLDKSNRKLRNFGFLFSVMIPLFAIVLLPLIRQTTPNYYSLIISIILVFIALIKPTLLKSLDKIWTILSHYLGLIKSKIFLTLLYYFIITPYGLILKLLIKGQIGLTIDQNIQSYKRVSK